MGLRSSTTGMPALNANLWWDSGRVWWNSNIWATGDTCVQLPLSLKDPCVPLPQRGSQLTRQIASSPNLSQRGRDKGQWERVSEAEWLPSGRLTEARNKEKRMNSRDVWAFLTITKAAHQSVRDLGDKAPFLLDKDINVGFYTGRKGRAKIK